MQNINCLFSVGWIYWKNKFEFSIYGSNGFISISGLGGSYGSEKLTLGIRNMKGGKPTIKKFYFKGNDLSWKKESIDFLIFVSQTPDYVLPATACVLQKKLG